MNGHGTSSISKAIGEQSSACTPVSDECASAICPQDTSPSDGEGLQGITSEELDAAMARAERAARNAYQEALWCFDLKLWKAANAAADRGLAHIRQLVELSKIQPRS